MKFHCGGAVQMCSSGYSTLVLIGATALMYASVHGHSEGQTALREWCSSGWTYRAI